MSKRQSGVYGEKRFLKWDTLNARGSKGGFVIFWITGFWDY